MAGTPPKLLNNGESNATVTLFPPFGHVANLITDKRHGVALHRGEEHAAWLSNWTGCAVLIDDLDMRHRADDMEVVVLRTLQRDITGFLARIAINNPCPQPLLHRFANLFRH